MKNKIHMIFYLFSIILTILFGVFTILDYFKYDDILTAAPFYVFVFVRCFEFILPAIICVIVGFILKRKHRE